ncbi:MAG: flagellar motor protein MotB [Gammaproteobacteria bacterium]
MSERKPPKKDDGGGAGWIMTFADLMSLLMCFFVLLLSFAELDVMKFKAIAGSMKLAFGVQREIRAIEVPKGTSIVAQEFSSGRPDPTVINEIRQETMDDDKQSLEFTDALVDDPEGTRPQESDGGGGNAAAEQALLDAERLVAALQHEVDEGMIQIETEGATIIIRIREKGSFPSGRATFDPEFEPVIERLRESLTAVDGTIAVAGHTDDIPIKTNRYRSNWELSSARAVSVVHALLDRSTLDPARFVVEGHGDAHPLAPNDTAENRALNRRVEITIRSDATGPAARREVVAQAPDASPQAPAAEEVPDWVPRPPQLVPDMPAPDATPLPVESSEPVAAAGSLAAGSQRGDADMQTVTPDAAIQATPAAADWTQPAASEADWSQPTPAEPEWSQPAADPPAAPEPPPSRLSRIRDGMRAE